MDTALQNLYWALFLAGTTPMMQTQEEPRKELGARSTQQSQTRKSQVCLQSGWGLTCPLGPSTKEGEGTKLSGFPRLRTSGMNPIPVYKYMTPLQAALTEKTPYTHSVDICLPPRVTGRRCWVALLVRSTLGSS